MVPLQKIKIANNLFSDLNAAEGEIEFLNNQLIVSDSIVNQLRRINAKYYNNSIRLLEERDRAMHSLVMVKNTLHQRDEKVEELKSKLKMANYTSVGLTGACLLVLLVAVI